MTCQITEMTINDYDEVYALWKNTPGIGLSAADSRAKITFFLARNPGLSFVARADQRIVGAILCGQDGRRGYLHHLAVHPDERKQGIGQALAERCLEALRLLGIDRCHIFVYRDNLTAQAFWTHTGWFERMELVLMSYDV